MLNLPENITKKIIQERELEAALSRIRKKSQQIVFTNGCFDIIHPGHLHLLAGARSEGDVLIVGLNSDASVKRLKGSNRPINCQQDRALTLAALELVDHVIIFHEDTPAKLIAQITPDVLVKGGDYKPDEIVGSDHVRASGGKVLTIPLLEGYSTTLMAKNSKKE